MTRHATAAQLRYLRWVADGCPFPVPKGTRWTTAHACWERGWMRMWGGGVRLTAAGRAELAAHAGRADR